MPEMDGLLKYAGKTYDQVKDLLQESAGKMDGMSTVVRELLQDEIDKGTIDKSKCESDTYVQRQNRAVVQVNEFTNGGDGIGIPYRGKKQFGINNFNIPYA